MKNIIIGLVATTAFLAAMPATAGVTNYTVNGETPAQCGVSGPTSATITGGAAGIADANGMLDAGLQGGIINALNASPTLAWCTGLSLINLTRTPLVRVGTNGSRDSSGFARAIGYDVAVKIAGARRLVNLTTPNGSLEGSADGPLGPFIRAFGPTGGGSLVTFLNDDFTVIGSFNATPRTLNLSSSPTYTGPSFLLQAQRINTPTRLAAGAYSSTVTLTLRPVT